jgi:hypothetical protein
MGWDIRFFRLKQGADPLQAEDPSDEARWESLGTLETVAARMRASLPDARWPEPDYCVARRDGCEFRLMISMRQDDPDQVSTVVGGVHERGDPFPVMRALAKSLDCHVLELTNLSVVDLSEGSAEGLERTRALEAMVARIRDK